MKRPLKPDEQRLWSLVAATIHPLAGRVVPEALPAPEVTMKSAAAKPSPAPSKGAHPLKPPARTAREAPEFIEPRRKHRIARERDPIGARIDLHGMDQDRARAALDGFLRRAWDEGFRAVLVITGKGMMGDGILRRRTPEWLAAPGLRDIVAGIAEAHRRHGGEGALYVALKRKPRG
ncbi:MAG: Smr/MutS family protein [Phenylobacterium sp.]|uniref:Smr/MutS family protein n=1 Tax=Phenylobacterium sp. TaxID=1871053 RepID=UPI002736ECE1|nr:Smr/MutS family protein [Phenylobacterium sp.]MDP3175497.1 Smr/MutS family protein [Phenylobacterium sp.]